MASTLKRRCQASGPPSQALPEAERDLESLSRPVKTCYRVAGGSFVFVPVHTRAQNPRRRFLWGCSVIRSVISWETEGGGGGGGGVMRV